MTGKTHAESGFDIIGDVHGCANALVRLLQKLGYRKINGVFGHKHRKAIFLGDIIDRGTHIREALHIVRGMVDRGTASVVMGNHEYNAITYCTRAHPDSHQQFLREHNARHDKIIRETLEQFAHCTQEWKDFLEWFKTMPLFIEEEHFRVVHACWDRELIAAFKQTHPQGVIDDNFLHASAVRGSFEGHVMDRLLRGTDMALPKGITITSKDGYVRSFFRTKFWAIDPQTYSDVLFQPDQLPPLLQHRAISDQERARIVTYSEDEIPVFIGHYWLSGQPAPIRANIGCLDYSAVKDGKLVAYQMGTEKQLRKDCFIWENVSTEAFG